MAARTTRKAKGERSPKAGPGRRGRSSLDLARLRGAYALTRPVLARILGVTEATLASWEAGRSQPGSRQRTRVQRAETILRRAAGAMRLAYLPTWLETPSPACAELGAPTPLGLLERGDYEAVEGLLYSLGSGVPF